MMSDFFFALLRSGLILTVSAAIVLFAMRVFKIVSPTIRRVAYFAVVLQGCCLAQWSIDIPLLSQEQSIPVIQTETLDVGSDLTANEPIQIPNEPALQLAIDTKSKQVDFTATATAFGSHEGIDWQGYLLLLWAAGILAIVARTAWNYIKFIQNMSSQQAINETWQNEWNALQIEAGFSRFIPLQMTEQAGPMICWFPNGYRLILPEALWTKLSQAQRTSILQHELAHVKRRDVWKSLTIRVLALPHWFNPMVWQVIKQFDDCAEWACDEVARANRPQSTADFAQALLQLGNSSENHLLMNLGVQGHGLAHRIRRLLVNTDQKDSMMKKIAVALLVVGISTFSLLKFQLVADEPNLNLNFETDISNIPDDSNKLLLTTQDNSLTFQIEAGELQLTGEFQLTDTESVADSSEILKVETPVDESKVDVLTFDISTSTYGRDDPSDSPGKEAIVDLGYLFKNLQEFKAARTKYQAKLVKLKQAAQARADELEALHKRLEKLVQDPELRITVKSMAKVLRENKIRLAQESATAEQKFHEMEAALHSRMYNKILTEVHAYAKEKEFDIVRRKVNQPATFKLTSDQISGFVAKGVDKSPDEKPETKHNLVFDENGQRYFYMVNSKYMSTAKRKYHLSSNLAKDPKSILTRMNQEILYVKDKLVKSEDITQAILKRLNDRYAKKQAENK